MADQPAPRLVVDPGVLISAIISPLGPSADLLRAIRSDQITLVASPKLLDELRAVLAREKFRRYLSADEADEYVAGLRVVCELVDDRPIRRPSPAMPRTTTSSRSRTRPAQTRSSAATKTSSWSPPSAY